MRDVIERLQEAKRTENAAKQARIEVEYELLDMIAPDDIPSEGSKTISGDGYKITLTQRVSRKLDEKAYALIVDSIPEEIRPVEVVETFQIDDRGCRWLAQNEPGYWRTLSNAITEKPMKIAVHIKELKV